MTAVWFTSDPHFGHRFVADLRGFASVEDHDAALMDAYRSRIRKQDTVLWLGDLAANDPAHALTLIAALPGTHHLIWGNHDRGHPMHRNAHRWQRPYLQVFASTQAYARRRLGPTREALLSHHPYTGDHTSPDRHAQYRLRDEGTVLIHGHVHSPERVTWSHARDLPTLQVHVGVDAWGLAPVHLDDVTALVEASLR